MLKKTVFLVVLICIFVSTLSVYQPSVLDSSNVLGNSTVFGNSTFTNPIKPATSADPSIYFKDGYYYYCWADGNNKIFVSRAKRLQDIDTATQVNVWTAPSGTMYSQNLWAPELLYLDNKWYIYFAADDGNNNNHRMYVLESNSQNAQGAYTFRGKIAPTTDKWAIDGTVLEKADGTRYFVWSGWEGDTNVRQCIYIARMSNAYTITGERVRLSIPDKTWEQVGTPHVQEAPQILVKNGVYHIIYSASGSWTDDYCLGRLTCTDGNVMNASSWTKTGPVFKKAATAYGPGHCSFTKSPDGKEDWIVYHACELPGGGWDGRSIRAQKFTWSGNNPSFGTPVATGTAITVPSGTPSDTVRYEAENATINNATIVNEANSSNGKCVGYIDYSDSYVQFTVNVPVNGTYPIRVRYSNGSGATSTHNVSVNGRTANPVSYGNFGWYVWQTITVNANLNAGNNTIRFTKGTNYATLDYIDVCLDGIRYEAENATLNKAQAVDVANASNGKKVGYIDYADSYVQFNVNCLEAGWYKLYMVYGNGCATNSTHYLTTNGSAPLTLVYRNLGWNVWTAAEVNVYLNAGNNTIRFTKGDGFAELDYIQVRS